MSEKPSENYFKVIEGEAKKYGWGLMVLKPETVKETIKKILMRFGKAKILEIGAFKCMFKNWLEKHFKGKYEYVGVDIADFGCPDNAKFYVMAPTYLMFPPRSFNTVVMFETLEHIFDYPQALREAYRVLVDGGVLIVQSVICTDKCALLDETHYHVLHPITLSRLLKHIGFRKVEWKADGTFIVVAEK